MLFIKWFRELRIKEPVLFYLFLSFFLIQFFFTLIKVEVTPFLLYGMYSEKFYNKENVFVLREIFLDVNKLDSLNISTSQKDLLATRIDNYISIKKNNNTDLVKSHVESKFKFLTSSSLYPFLKDRIYNNIESIEGFPAWYKIKAGQIIGSEIREITVTDKKYLLHKKPFELKLIASDTITRF